MTNPTIAVLISQGILSEVWKHKLLFVETPDAMETSVALKNFREVSPCGLQSHQT